QKKIFNTYDLWQTTDKFSYVAPLEEIIENDFNLNIPRYVDTYKEEEEIDIIKAQTDIDNINKELQIIETKMSSCLTELFQDE
ncbi:MAG: N-6 DNA methylase, partial [Candidatus Scalindua sp.]|nr:N-6 DNA methylase [Candidatus Scalindua sp.]